MKHLRYRVSVAALPLLLALIGPAQAQAPTRAEAQAALSSAPARFTKSQLDQMLAPIALYPDQLLTQVLMAATFPQQLIDAQKWLQDSGNAALKGDDLANALQSLPWDPSVKSLVAFPQVVGMMTDHLDWTESLGAAFANQQVETMARVQFLRERAKQAGRLKSTTQYAVREESSDIIIEPTDPNMIYVPVYNPAQVYGDWPDRDAPPVYIPPPPRYYDREVGPGIDYSVGVGVIAPLWGWGRPDWRRHEVVVDPDRYRHITNQDDITRNRTNVEGQVWHRSGPIAQVPEEQRPHPPQPSGPAPAGTIRPSEVAHPPGTPGAGPGGPAAGPRPGEPPRPGQAGAPPGEPPRWGEPPHPGEPPGQRSRPGEPPRPGEVHPGPAEAQPGLHPGEPSHPQEAHPGAPAHPPEASPAPHPAEPLHPAEAPHPAPPAAEQPHPAPAPAPHPPAAEPPHPATPPAPAPHPPAAEPPHPAPAPPPPQAPHPEPPHPAPAAAPPPQAPHPEPPHPAPAPAPPPQAPHPEPPHPAPAPAPPPQAPHPEPPHPAPAPAAPPPAAHPAPPQPPAHPSGPPPEKKPPPKPGEEQQQQH